MKELQPEPVPVDAYLSDIRCSLPSVDAVLSRYNSMKLRDYVTELVRRRVSGFQSGQDFIDECVVYTRETLGERSAAALRDDLGRNPSVLTANHHGIDTFAQSTQTNLLFALRNGSDGELAKTVPVLACGSIPLNNLTYPRGLLVYSTGDAAGPGEIFRLPIFPDSQKRTLVSRCRPFTTEMLERARARATTALDQKQIASGLQPALNALFASLADLAQGYPDYSRQATLANNRIWQLLFNDRSMHSDLIYIELEKIVARLLRRDLFDPSTICHQLLFDRELRNALVQNLDGQRACWQFEKLAQYCSGADSGSAGSDGGAPIGTLFFWGVDGKGRSFPLCVHETTGRAPAVLRGVDSRGQAWQCPLEPDPVDQALRDGHLLPSVFTSYLAVSIARGVDCIGGYYQASYLPIMKQGVIAALNGVSRDSSHLALLTGTQPDPYLSGMQTIGISANGETRPAGPIEIIAGGGLNEARFRQIGEMTLGQAHIASLYDTILDTEPDGVDIPRAKRELAGLVHDALDGDILVVRPVEPASGMPPVTDEIFQEIGQAAEKLAIEPE